MSSSGNLVMICTFNHYFTNSGKLHIYTVQSKNKAEHFLWNDFNLPLVKLFIKHICEAAERTRGRAVSILREHAV